MVLKAPYFHKNMVFFLKSQFINKAFLGFFELSIYRWKFLLEIYKTFFKRFLIHIFCPMYRKSGHIRMI